MSVKLLCAWGQYPYNAIITLDANTEASMVSAKVATTDLTGGVVWVPQGPGQPPWPSSTQVAALNLLNQQTICPARVAILGNSITGFGAALRNINSYTSWAANSAISLSAAVFPQFSDLSGGINAIKWVCTTAGTTGAIEPAWKWSDPVGTTYTDGTVVWTAQAETTTPFTQWAWGFWHMAQARSGQRAREVCVVHRSGMKSATIMAYHDRMLATNPDIVFYATMWENDVGNNAVVLATVQADFAAWVAAADAVRAQGKTVWVADVLPSASVDSSSAFTGYSAGNGTNAWNWLNRKIREYAAARRDVVLIPWSQAYLDSNPATPTYPENTTTFTSSTGTGQALKWTDGVHGGTNAHWRLSGYIVPALNRLPEVAYFSPSLDTDQIVTNPNQFGTSGTRGATIGSGTVPNSLTADAFGGTAGSTSVAQVARPDLVTPWTKVTGVAAAAASGDAISLSYTAAAGLGDFVAGDVCQGFAELKIDANPTLLTIPQTRVRMHSAASSWVYSGSLPTNEQDLAPSITADTTLLLKTPPFMFQSGTTGVSVYNRAEWRGAAAVNASFGRMAMVRLSAKDLV